MDVPGETQGTVVRPRVVLVGPSGAGKSTVGRLVAERLGVGFRDTDADVEARAGKSVADVFVTDGEPAFRALERDAVRAALTEHDGVLALGGGAVVDGDTRALLAGHRVVFLDVSLAPAVHRVGLDTPRPLLTVNPRATMRAMLEERRPYYLDVAAAAVVDTDDRTPEEVADAVVDAVLNLPLPTAPEGSRMLRSDADRSPATSGRIGKRGSPMSESTRITVGGAAPYDVAVGTDLLGELPAALGDGVRQVAVVTTASVRPLAERACAVLSDAGLRPCRIEVPDAEAGKDISVAAMCWGRMGERAFTRGDAVVGVGGGAVTDLAGFVAATWLRGVRVVHVPTTLLGMVDASVGGKTGVNTSAGKNLVGAFHPPAAVLCDLVVLGDLPRVEYVNGLAEVVKAGLLADPRILDLVENDAAGTADPAGPHTRELVERSVRFKAEIVTDDLRESGRREWLNYGHTLGHALERVERYRWRHGHAVSVGLVYAAELARLAGSLDDVTAKRHRTVLEAVGLPTRYRADAWPELLDAMRVDKKARGAVLRFVVLGGPGRPAILADPAPELLERAYAAVAEV